MQAIKQLLPWGGSTLLEHTIETALRSRADQVYLVLGANKELISEKLSQNNFEVIENDNWQTGMGGSIASGANAILDRSIPQGILVMLCDQPLIDPEYLNQMIDAFQTGQHSIIGTFYGAKIGVPALFGVQHFRELCFLEGTKGAGSIIKEYPSDCMGLQAHGKEVDIDTDTAYHELYSSFHPGN